MPRPVLAGVPGQANLGPRPQTRPRDDAQAAAGRLDPHALRGEPDVTVRQPLAEPLRIEPGAVVLDHQQHLVAQRPERHGDHLAPAHGGRRWRASSRTAEKSSWSCAPAAPGCDVEPQLDARALRGTGGHRAHGGVEPRLVENVRVELEDRVAQLVHGLDDSACSARPSAG